MFLTKKTASNQTKKPTNTRALGGWGDTEDDKNNNNKINDNNILKKNIQNNPKYSITSNTSLLDTNNEVLQTKIKVPSQKNQVNKAQCYYPIQQLSVMNNIQCEIRVVQSIIQPGGIRIKPNQTILNQFYNQSKTLDIFVIGSLLISQLYLNQNGFFIRAKALYAIQYLCKKSIQYSIYFKFNVNYIKNSPQTIDNTENYNKIKKNILAMLGAQIQSQNKQQQINDYVDPGYNTKEQVKNQIKNVNNEKDKQKKPIKFISPTQAKNKGKKPLQGPPVKDKVQKVPKEVNKNYNLLDEPSEIKNEIKDVQKNIDLLQLDDNKQKQNQLKNYDILGSTNQQQKIDLTFDQLMEKQKFKKNNQLDFVI